MPKRKPGWVKTELSLDTCCKIRGFGVSPKGIENESQHGIEKGSKSTLVAPSTEFVRFYGLLAGADFLMSFQGAQNDILMPRRRVPGAAAPSIREPVPRSAGKPGGPVGPIYPLRVRRYPRRVRKLRVPSLYSHSLSTLLSDGGSLPLLSLSLLSYSPLLLSLSVFPSPNLSLNASESRLFLNFHAWRSPFSEFSSTLASLELTVASLPGELCETYVRHMQAGFLLLSFCRMSVCVLLI